MCEGDSDMAVKKGKLDYRSAMKKLEKGEIPQILLVSGDESFLIEHLLSCLRQKVLAPGFESLDALSFDGMPSLDTLLAEIQTPPFYSPRKYVRLRHSELFSGAGASGEKEQFLEKIIAALHGQVCLVFEEVKIDRRKKKNLELVMKNGWICQIDKEGEAELRAWIRAAFASEKLKIQAPASESLMRRCQYQMQDLHFEIRKLSDYAHYAGIEEIDLALIDHCCREDLNARVFDLLAAMGRGERDTGLLCLDRMLKNQEPAMVIHLMMGRQFRHLLLAKESSSAGDLAKRLHLPDFVARRLMKECRGFPEKELRNLCHLAFELDEAVKRGEIHDRLALEMMILQGTQDRALKH